MKNSSICITGANGFIGSAISNYLFNNKIPILPIVRNKKNNLNHHISSVAIGEITSKTNWSNLLKNVDCIIHCAGIAHQTENKNSLAKIYKEVNVDSTLHLAEQASKIGVRRFIFLSSLKVNGEITLDNFSFSYKDKPNPKDIYAISKFDAENGLREIEKKTNLEVVIIRPPLVYGPKVKANFQKLIRLTKSNFPLPLGSIKNKRSLIGIDNLIDLINVCINHNNAPKQTFLTSDGYDVSTPELIKTISKAMNKNIMLIPFPVIFLTIIGKFLKKKDQVEKMISSLCVDISHTCTTLGWKPHFSIDSQMKSTVDYYLKHFNKKFKMLNFQRSKSIFFDDINDNNYEINNLIQGARFLVIGGAGSIGQSVAIEIFKRNPAALHVVDISENNLVELVRNIRSSLGYINGDFKTLAIDFGSIEFEVFLKNQKNYDYILNLSALKHVRSERDPYTLMRLLQVNIFYPVKLLKLIKNNNTKKLFCVSTDKAANPINMMGASKKIMEKFLLSESTYQNISMSRFANVAFSDGSLLKGFKDRLEKKQPIAAPNDVQRYFINFQEAGEMSLLSCLLGENRTIFFPKNQKTLTPISFSEIAKESIISSGFEPYVCENENEARSKFNELYKKKKWACFFFKSDTTGEKQIEEFYEKDANLNLKQFKNIGIINNNVFTKNLDLKEFVDNINELRNSSNWTKIEIINLFKKVCPEFIHDEKSKNLDEKM